MMLAAANVRNLCLCVYSTSGGFPAIVPRGRWCFKSQRVGCLAWSLDGIILVSGRGDDSIFLWCPGAVPLHAQGRDHGVGVRRGRREFVLLLLRDCLSLSFFPFVGQRRRGGGWGLDAGIRRCGWLFELGEGCLGEIRFMILRLLGLPRDRLMRSLSVIFFARTILTTKCLPS
jgi:hypothetical protein